jgi:hypothetical protein
MQNRPTGKAFGEGGGMHLFNVLRSQFCQRNVTDRRNHMQAKLLVIVGNGCVVLADLRAPAFFGNEPLFQILGNGEPASVEVQACLDLVDPPRELIE